MKTFTNRKRPSPKDKHICLARGTLPPTYRKSNHYITFRTFIEKVSPFAIFQKDLRASMTLETALILPLFLFFFLNLGSAVEMLRLHGNLAFALRDVGSRLCVYGSAAETFSEGERLELPELADIALSYTYVKGEVTELLSKEYLDASPLQNGTASLQFLGSDLINEEDCVEIDLTYRVAPAIGVIAFRPFALSNHFYGRIFSGYDVAGDDEEAVAYAYLAENASVYHLDPGCTHLRLSVSETFVGSVPALRNADGGRYLPCEICGRGPEPQTVFIARTGDRYHYRRDCPGLKRTVTRVELTTAMQKYPLCKRCAQKGEAK